MVANFAFISTVQITSQTMLKASPRFGVIFDTISKFAENNDVGEIVI